MLRYLALTAAVALAAPSTAFASEWVIDQAHSEVGFKVKHLMVSNVRGRFGKFEGKLSLNDKDVSKSTVEVSIDVGSIDTGNDKRDGHLKSPDFFAAGKHPRMTFKSTKVRAAGKGKLEVLGNLTIRGVTKSVVLMVEGPTDSIKDPWGNVKRGVSASTTIRRKDFGLKWNKLTEAGGVVVGDEVTIQLEIELNKSA
ncbi:MAG: YceI family protein [Myxococcota bacterium]